MAETIFITCPACGKQLKVPAAAAGKKVRCKGCQGVLPVPAGTGKVVDTRVTTPQARDKAAELAAEEAEAKNPYGVTYDSDAPRCPFCAHDIDPPDARICIHCGYDLQARARRTSTKVYQRTALDFIMWHLPTLGAFLGILGVIGGLWYYHFKLPENLLSPTWAAELKRDRWGYFDESKEYEATGWIFHWAIEVWLIVIGLFIMWRLGRFLFVRLAFQFLPPEAVKQK